MGSPVQDPLVRRASSRLALQAAGLVAAAMLLLIALVTVFLVRGEASATDTLLHTTAASADDVGDPPVGAWIVLDRGAGISVSPGLPRDVRPALARLRRNPPAKPSLRTLSDSDGDDFRVLTERRPGRVVQVVLNLASQEAARSRLIQATAAAAAVALGLSAGLGIVLGRRAVRPLAHALSLQRAFVADASHELRTPLTLLSTRAQLLDGELRTSPTDPRVLQDSAGVLSDIQRLAEVVEDLLAIADPRRNDEAELVDLPTLVREVAASAAPSAAAAGVAVTAAPSVAVSKESGPRRVLGSAAALRRAVLALVDNAIDHTPAGGEVRLGVRGERRAVVVAVSDTGPGIAPQDAERVLHRFSSGGQRAGRPHYGLGLALTSDVANRHGGHLRLAPSAAGATFELILPAAQSRRRQLCGWRAPRRG
ncbi:MAG: HAMP domain-containing sensor histidine kinase [Frankiaceae bacterium]